MYLAINLAEKDCTKLVLFSENKIKHFSNEKTKNSEILSEIDSFISAEKIAKEEIKGIAVVVGVGGFTSTRLATTVANIFAYCLQIPLLAIKLEQLKNIQEIIPTFLKAEKGKYISATYSGEPNIGGKK